MRIACSKSIFSVFIWPSAAADPELGASLNERLLLCPFDIADCLGDALPRQESSCQESSASPTDLGMEFKGELLHRLSEFEASLSQQWVVSSKRRCIPLVQTFLDLNKQRKLKMD